MELNGKVVTIFPKNQISEKFAKREIVIETEDQYPQKIIIQFVQDKCELLDSYMTGEEVKIGVNINGREWTSPTGEVKYFNTIQGWFIDHINKEGFDSKKYAENEANKVFEHDITNQMAEDQENDLPF
tara:strand:- start:603 stop:986 length:384 start_codon:yes stop_codon:yes gene_type:complete